MNLNSAAARALAFIVTAFGLVGLISKASAQNTVFTYQGRVTDGGTNFSGSGQFKFALVTSTNVNHTATATATITSGFVTGITVTDGGNGYVSAPAVTISGGGGSGATAHATISGGAVASISVDNAGSGYTTTPAVTVAAPPANVNYTTYWSNDGTSAAGSEPGAAVNVNVSSGLFTVTLGDTTVANMSAIDASVFQQPNLQLRIWFNDSANGFAVLNPVQNLTPTPYAVAALNASNLLGTVTATQLPASANFAGTISANSFSGNGANVTNVNALSLNGLNAGNFWQLSGNNVAAGQFVGSTNNQPVEVRVNNHRAMLISSSATDAPNLVGGAAINAVDAGVQGAVIAGGGSTNFHSYPSTNRVSADFGAIVGGGGNWIQQGADHAIIGGGWLNSISAGSYQSVIAGGQNNAISNSYSVIGGGENNIASGPYDTVGGGDGNIASYNTDYYGVNGAATIGGGSGNTAGGSSTVAGGINNIAIGTSYNIGYDIGYFPATVSGGANNKATGSGSVVGGGGGYDSYWNFNYGNTATNYWSTIGGGASNIVTGASATIPGGMANVAAGDYSFAAGELAQALHNGAFVWADSQNATFSSTGTNQFLIRAGGGVGINTTTIREGSVMINTNVYMNDHPIYLRGTQAPDHNHGLAYNGNGITNFVGNYQIDGPVLFGYGGGVLGTRNGSDRGVVVWNGAGVTVAGTGASSGGVSGFNEVTAHFTNSSTVSHSAISVDATTNHDSIVYFAESGVARWGIRANHSDDSFNIRWHGNGANTTLVSVQATNGNMTVSGTVTANGVQLTSDRNAKENFEPLDATSVLTKVASLPMTQWNYKTDSAQRKHIGPMAQDFHAAFGLNGGDDTHISVIDEGGVALAAIQGLNRKVEDQQSELKQKADEISELKQQNAALEHRLENLERLIGSAREK